jgi:hypothetical protein
MYQAFVEAPKTFIQRNEVYLEDPEAFAAERVEICERLGIVRPDPRQLAIAGPVTVVELADDVTGDLAAEAPSGTLSRTAGKGVELGARYSGVPFVVRPHGRELEWQGSTESVFRWIAT